MKALHLRMLLKVDAIGAGLSAVVHVLVLPQLDTWIRMPRQVLMLLGGVAFLYLVHDILGLMTAKGREGLWLRRIVFANLVYCLATAGLVVWQLEGLTHWDLLYFLPEILIVLALARVEWRAVRVGDGSIEIGGEYPASSPSVPASRNDSGEVNR